MDSEGNYKMIPEQTTDYYPYGLPHEKNNLHLNDRLFSGKELINPNIGNLGSLGIYDFGARHYDPVLGRWFNVDPALQLVNPYVYCGNSPAMYMDPDGRWIWLIPVIGGTINWASHGFKFTSEGAGYFVIGAAAASVAVFGHVDPLLVAGGLSAANDIWGQGMNKGFSNIDYRQTATNVVSSMALYALGGQVSEKLKPYMDKVFSFIPSPVFGHALSNGATQFATSYTVATGFNMANGMGFEEASNIGLKNASLSGMIGFASGAADGFAYAKKSGINPWMGQSLKQKQLNFAPSADDQVTLYRGMSGKEDPNKPLFMTDDPNYARSYNTNNVQEVTMSRSAFKYLEHKGRVQSYKGMNSTTGSYGTEYKITNPELNKYILQNLKAVQ